MTNPNNNNEQNTTLNGPTWNILISFVGSLRFLKHSPNECKNLLSIVEKNLCDYDYAVLLARWIYCKEMQDRNYVQYLHVDDAELFDRLIEDVEWLTK